VPYSIADKLVIAVASSALFDLTESHKFFLEHGVEQYRKYQRENEKIVLATGVAFPLIKRLLALNDGHGEGGEKVVEVILFSRNDPDTGLRVFNSIKEHALDITRAVFVSGRDPIPYLPAFNAALFLSANETDVRNALMQNAPAGQVFPTTFVDDDEPELRVAFDFDGVITDDSAEAINQTQGLAEFLRSEQEKAGVPHPLGPLYRFFSEMAKLQQRERNKQTANPDYKPRVRIAIVTARNAPAHERVVTSLRKWGIEVDEVFFLGGLPKANVLRVFRPHIFFDDQKLHIEGAADIAPSAHVPFGLVNDATAKLRKVNEQIGGKAAAGPNQ
jgi:5'-nucleotidase